MAPVLASLWAAGKGQGLLAVLCPSPISRSCLYWTNMKGTAGNMKLSHRAGFFQDIYTDVTIRVTALEEPTIPALTKQRMDDVMTPR